MTVKQIAIIGAGKMAAILGQYFSKAGHQVYIGARKVEKARRLANKLGNEVSSGTVEEVVGYGDIVFFAIPYLQIQDTVKSISSLKDKIVVDISNPLKPDFSGLLLGGDTSAAEELAKMTPGARVVKAFNSIFATVLERGPVYGDNKAQVFYAGDDAAAKQAVAELIEATGFEAIDAGKLSSARYLEQLTVLVIQIDNHLEKPIQITPAMLSRPSIQQ